MVSVAGLILFCSCIVISRCFPFETHNASGVDDKNTQKDISGARVEGLLGGEISSDDNSTDSLGLRSMKSVSASQHDHQSGRHTRNRDKPSTTRRSNSELSHNEAIDETPIEHQPPKYSGNQDRPRTDDDIQETGTGRNNGRGLSRRGAIPEELTREELEADDLPSSEETAKAAGKLQGRLNPSNEREIEAATENSSFVRVKAPAVERNTHGTSPSTSSIENQRHAAMNRNSEYMRLYMFRPKGRAEAIDQKAREVVDFMFQELPLHRQSHFTRMYNPYFFSITDYDTMYNSLLYGLPEDVPLYYFYGRNQANSPSPVRGGHPIQYYPAPGGWGDLAGSWG